MRVGARALAGLLLAGAFFIFYFVFAATVGFHGPRASWDAYGEPPVGPPIEQPICFWTDLAFVVSGIAALASLDRERSRDPIRIGLGLVIVWMGPASMLEHGTLAQTWGWFDATSIHWFTLFVVGSFVLRGRAFWIVEAVAWLAIGAWTWRDESVRKNVSGVLLLLMGVVTLATVAVWKVKGRATSRTWWSLAGLAASFFIAMAFLGAGARDGPAAPWGHGAWHLCCAAATFFTFRLLGSCDASGLERRELPGATRV